MSMPGLNNIKSGESQVKKAKRDQGVITEMVDTREVDNRMNQMLHSTEASIEMEKEVIKKLKAMRSTLAARPKSGGRL